MSWPLPCERQPRSKPPGREPGLGQQLARGVAASRRCSDTSCGLAAPSCCPCRYLPHIGRVTIIMNDYPMFKYALIAILGVFVLTSKE